MWPNSSCLLQAPSHVEAALPEAGSAVAILNMRCAAPLARLLAWHRLASAVFRPEACQLLGATMLLRAYKHTDTNPQMSQQCGDS